MDVGELCNSPMVASEIPSPFTTNTDDSGPSQSVPRSEWRFEEAEMPQISMKDVALDGLYYCQREECGDRKGFQQKGLFR